MSSTTDQTQSPHSGDPASRPLRRPLQGRMLAGVAAALARHFHVDVTIVRIGFAVATIVGFTGLPYFGWIPIYLAGIPLYLAGWLLIPEEGSDHSIAGRFFAARSERSG